MMTEFYPYNFMKTVYCPRDEYEFVLWGWSSWDLSVAVLNELLEPW